MKGKYFNLHRHSLPKDPEEYSIVNIFPEKDVPENCPYSVGFHPWFVSADRIDISIMLVEEKGAGAAAIGECGLDRACKIQFELQLKAFRAQIGIAGKLGKPLIIHCVRAYPDIISEKKSCGGDLPWIVHGFRRNAETAIHLIKHGFYLSFGEALIKDPGLGEVLRQVPSDKFFLETDESGTGIRDVYRAAAECLGIGEGELASIMSSNTQAVFKQLP